MSIRFPKHERGLHRGCYCSPQGELLGTFQQLMDAGCIQAEASRLMLYFHAIMIATAENPCGDCPVWETNGSGCTAFRQYHSAYRRAEERQKQTVEDATTPHNVPVDHSLAGLSVRKIAKKLGVSIGEVRRRKASGTL